MRIRLNNQNHNYNQILIILYDNNMRAKIRINQIN